MKAMTSRPAAPLLLPLLLSSLLLLFPAIQRASAWPIGVDDSHCRHHLPASDYLELQRTVEGHPVAIYAVDRPMRCTVSALQRFDAAGACYALMMFTDEEYQFRMDETISHPLWRYHACAYPENIVGGMQMHSYVWIDGRMHGNGFDMLENRADRRLNSSRWLSAGDLERRLDDAGAARGCKHGVQQHREELRD